MKSMKAQRKENDAKAKGRSIVFVFTTCAVAFLAFTSGCGNKFWDPAQVGRFRPVPSVNVILDSLGVAEETEAAWKGGEEPRPSDTVVMETDYVFRAGDIVRITIFELLREGLDSISDYVVTETGKISIPDVGVVEAAGLTETQLEEEIRQILSPSILKDPSVTVMLLVSQQRTFSIIGDGVGAPGRYAIPRYDFRLTDALATARGQRQFNVENIYVSRITKNGGATSGMFDSDLGIEVIEPAGRVPDAGTDASMLEIIAPRAQSRTKVRSDVVIASAEMATLSEYGDRRRSPGYATADNLGGLLSNTGSVNEPVGSSLIVRPGLEDQSETAVVSEIETGLTADTPDTGLLLEEPAADEQVSVGDILKTLAARSQGSSPVNAAAPSSTAATTSVQGAALPRRTQVSQIDLRSPAGQTQTPTIDLRRPTSSMVAEPDAAVSEQESELDSLMKTLGQRQRSTQLDNRSPVSGAASPVEPVVGGVGESSGVESILETLEARTGGAPAEEQAEWENLLESFAEPETPQGKAKSDEPADLDELLKSFAEPGVEAPEPDSGVPGRGMEDIGQQIDEQVGLKDVGIGIDKASAVEEPGIGLNELDISLAPRVGGQGDAQLVQKPGRIEWVFQDGKWVPMQIGTPAMPRPVISVDSQMEPSSVVAEAPTGTMNWGTGVETRLIKIPADKLMAGDPRYNIVIKPGDSIYVPVDVIGEFCIMGNVVRQGYIPITGRPLTLKMAVAAAGGLGPLAYPKRCEVTRRIGKKKEETVMVDLDKIANGEQPDFFIKPNDLINVGTHATSRWRAVLRNAFRASYGFGFVYDRNFALDNYYSSYGRTSRIDLSEAIKIF